jgi:mono/diheme cytochrome c family protein
VQQSSGEPSPGNKKEESIVRSPALFGAIVPGILAAPVQGPRERLIRAGRQTFETVCAACHGATGKPDPANPVVQALDPKPADLSDPLFNSREPASDWNIVVTHGGPALGLSASMPAQGAALSDEEIRNVVAYAKTLAPGSDQYPPGELNFFLPVRTKKAFPEDEIVWKGRVTERDGENVVRNVIELEKRFGKRSMGCSSDPRGRRIRQRDHQGRGRRQDCAALESREESIPSAW